jgi:type II secretory pathway component GspD/PulD (secretin)
MKILKTLALIGLFGLFLSPSPMPGQTFQTPVWPANPNSLSLAQIDPMQSALPSPTPIGDAQPAPPAQAAQPVQAIQPAPAPAAPAQDSQQPSGHILLNFQGAQLSDVLNYLSQAAGFIIVQDVPVTGTVNIISRQPVTADEAVDLLNTVLIEKNYVALRSGRILKIVNRADAQKLDLPVITGADPAQIPQKDNVVTQILPVRYADVSKLIDNLRPLLSDNAAISANDSSNAIILTDTQANVRRIAEIISALDTSISGVSTMRVFPLRYADAKELADVLTQLFQSSNSSSGGTQQPAAPGGFPGFGGFGGRRGGGGGGGGGDSGDSAKSEAREAASRVVAVADETSNSIIVDAPQEYMDSIGEIVTSLDTNITGVTETRIFTLLHADATEMSTVLSTLYSDSTTTGSQTQTRGGGRQGGFGFGFGQPQPAATANTPSERAVQQARVVVVADARTNAVIVTASRDSMEDIALTIGRLDSSDSKKQHVQIYTLENADPDNVAAILRDMFTTNGTSSSTSQTSEDALSQRTETGASSDIVNTLNTNGSTGGGGGGGGGGNR